MDATELLDLVAGGEVPTHDEAQRDFR